MSLPLVDGDTLLIDNARFEAWSKCPRMGLYQIFRRRILAGDKSALTFGGHLHAALKLRYTVHHTNACSTETEARQMVLLEKLFDSTPTAIGDHRTLGLAQEVISRYNEHYGNEPFNLLKTTGGQTIVEEPFAMPLGIVRGIKVVWIGVIDLPIIDSGEVFVMDHKSTSIGGENFFNDFQLSSQFMGYSWVLREKYKTPVKGAVVNGLVVRKPGKTDRAKDPIEFRRGKLYFDDAQLDEWRQDILHMVSDMITCDEQGYFPKHTTQCNYRYGQCQYFNVCSMSPSVRDFALSTNEYKDDEWDPLHAAAPDSLLQSILAIPSSQLTYTKQTKQSRKTIATVDDYMALLGVDPNPQTKPKS